MRTLRSYSYDARGETLVLRTLLAKVGERGVREKIRALEAEENALLKKMDKIRDMRMELQNECRHEEGFAASGKYTGLEFCVICRKPRLAKYGRN